MVSIVQYKITGTSSLLTNHPRTLTDPDKKGDSPEKQAAKRVYRLPNGQLFIPAEGFIRGVIRRACTGRKYGKLSAAAVVGGSVQIPDSELDCPLVHPKTGKPIKEYRIHAIRAVVDRSGIIRHRPEIPAWACFFTVEIDDDLGLTAENFLEHLKLAGRVAGRMDFRIDRGGRHGKYTAELVTGTVEKPKRRKGK